MKKVSGHVPEAETSDVSDAPGPEISGAVLMHLSLSRYAADFLLNEVEPTMLQSFPFIIPAIKGVELPGHAPSRRDTSVERLHHSRVSLRRMRSTLRTFDDLFNRRWSNDLRRELAWYGSVLGAARDLEVMRDNICATLGSDALTVAGVFVLGRIDDAIAIAHERLDQQRETERYRTMLTTVSTLTTWIEFTPAAYRPAARAMRRGLRSAWRNVKAARHDADRRPTPRRLHRLRIELKHLQYAAEIGDVAVGASVSRVAEGAEKLQTRLGGVHDIVVARRWLDQLSNGDGSGSGEVAALIGEIGKRYRENQRKALKGWRREMTRLDRRSNDAGL